MKCLVINGPNLNMLGKREPEVYGNMDLAAIEKYTRESVEKIGFKVEQEWFQSNDEAAIIDKLHAASSSVYDFVVINPAAYSHTSIAILDALNTLACPVVEVHLSNTNTREDFRQKKMTAKSCTAVIEGLKHKVYALAIISQLMN